MGVSLSATKTVGEDEGMIDVCATLSAMEDTERNVTIVLVTEDGTGKSSY